MEIINYILVIIICFLGLIAGFIVSKLAEEEIKPGKPYFILAKKLFLILFLGVFFYALKKQMMLNILTLVILIIAIALTMLKFSISPYITYPIMGLLLYFASGSQYFIVLCSIVFLYGIPVFALEPELEELGRYSSFLITGLFPVLVSLIF